MPLTRRMCHRVLGAAASHTLVTAVRHAQVRELGGSDGLARALCRTDLGARFQPDEEFHAHLIQWLCNHPELPHDQVAPILDWAEYQRQQRTDRGLEFSMKGRTVRAVLRDCAAWHTQLNTVRVLANLRYRSAGFPDHDGLREIRVGGRVVAQSWSVRELLSTRELHAEGRRMNHCVFSYDHAVRSGRSSIWSFELDGTRELTIEVHNGSRRVVQVRGRFNRLPTPGEMRLVGAWAERAGLALA